MTQLTEDLKALRQLFANKTRWTTENYAKSKTGRSVKAIGKAATCWCLLGGISKVTGSDSSKSGFGDSRYEELREAVRAAIGTDCDGSLVSLNDGEGLPAVRRTIRAAIKAAA